MITDYSLGTKMKHIECGIGKGSHIKTNQKRENNAFSLLIG